MTTNTASSPGGLRAHRSRNTRPGHVLAIVCAGMVLANLDLFIVNVALPDISRDFGNASLENLSWILNGYAIVYAALLVFFGRLRPRQQCRNPGGVPSCASGRGGTAHPDVVGADPGDLPG